MKWHTGKGICPVTPSMCSSGPLVRANISVVLTTSAVHNSLVHQLDLSRRRYRACSHPNEVYGHFIEYLRKTSR